MDRKQVLLTLEKQSDKIICGAIIFVMAIVTVGRIIYCILKETYENTISTKKQL